MLLLPSGIIVFAILMFVCRDWKQTAQWALLFGGVGAIVCASKLAFMGWGIGIRELDFTGFSGHSALSASIWPVMMWLLTGRFSTAVRKTAVLSGYALALLIGYSRLAIHVPPFRKSSAASHWGPPAAHFYGCSAILHRQPCHTEKSLPPYCFLCC